MVAVVPWDTAPVQVEIGVLGELRVVVDGVELTPRAPKERALLALLAVNRERLVTVDRLLGQLWPELPPDRGRHVLQVRIAEIRKLLGGVGAAALVESNSAGYRLRISAESLDADRFAGLVEAARVCELAKDTLGAAGTLRHALGLWRGEPFADVHGCVALQTEAARLTELRLGAIEHRIAAELADGCHQRLLPELEALVMEHPLRERLWEHRVLALYRCGRQTDALRALAAIRRILIDEVGVDRNPALQTLEADVLAQRATLDWVPTATARWVLPDPFEAPADRIANGTATSHELPRTGPAPCTPEVRYAKTSDGVHLAYQVVGEGPPDLIIIPGFISELDNWWEAWDGRLVRRLATFSRLILFDKRGTGLSDRPPAIDVDDWVEDVRTVLDAVGADRPVVVGMSAGGPIAILFAATYPERTGPLVLYGASPRMLTDGTEDYPSRFTMPEREALIARIEAGWGTGVALEWFCPSIAEDPEMCAQFGRFERRSASPGAASAYLRTLGKIDVRDALPLISTPTLVLHPTRDRAIPIAIARYTAARIPGAVLKELDTADHLIWFSEAIDAITDEIQNFVTGAVAADEIHRVLSTIVAVQTNATDLSGPGFLTELVHRHRGRTIGNRGDRFVAAFDGPAHAVRCASALSFEFVVAGIDVRVGVHSGEGTGNESMLHGGVAAHAGWMASLARPGEVVVSRVVHDLVAGSSFDFTHRGAHHNPEANEEWTVYALRRTKASNEASTST